MSSTVLTIRNASTVVLHKTASIAAMGETIHHGIVMVFRSLVGQVLFVSADLRAEVHWYRPRSFVASACKSISLWHRRNERTYPLGVVATHWTLMWCDVELLLAIYAFKTFMIVHSMRWSFQQMNPAIALPFMSCISRASVHCTKIPKDCTLRLVGHAGSAGQRALATSTLSRRADACTASRPFVLWGRRWRIGRRRTSRRRKRRLTRRIRFEFPLPLFDCLDLSHRR